MKSNGIACQVAIVKLFFDGFFWFLQTQTCFYVFMSYLVSNKVKRILQNVIFPSEEIFDLTILIVCEKMSFFYLDSMTFPWF